MEQHGNKGTGHGELSELRSDLAGLAESYRSSTEGFAKGIEALADRLDRQGRDLTSALDRSAERTDAKFDKVISEFRQSLQAQAKASSETAASIHERIERERKPPTAAISIAVGVILTLGGAFGSQYARDLGRQEGRLDELSDQVVERIQQGEYMRGINESHKESTNAALVRINEWMSHQRDETDDRTTAHDRTDRALSERIARVEEHLRLLEEIKRGR